MFRSIKAACMLFVLCSTALGYGLASFELIGFSGDGEYLAWEQYGMHDLTGFPFSDITVIYVPDGEIIAEFNAVLDLDSIDPAAAAVVESLWASGGRVYWRNDVVRE